MARVVLAMSGGVDSSVAAWLLREAGHEVVGVFMQHGQNREPWGEGCCGAANAADARWVAERLGIGFEVVDFREEFEGIVEYFVASYTAGRTPNPCVVCNARLKFGRLFEHAERMGAEHVATGHYARLFQGGEGGEVALCRGIDETKDQSYALFGIRRELLGRLIFPVGGYRKEEIRRIAGRLGLRVAEKRDSQEICFVPEDDHARFVRERRGDVDTSGEIVTTDGTVVGRHEGLEGFTIGQRKGLGVALGEPRFVVRIEPDTRRVVIGTREELARWELTAAEANWLVDEPREPFRCEVKIRYRSRAVGAVVEPIDGGRFHVRFDEARHGIAPGQAAVCYEGERVLGGGWIE